MRIWRCSAIRIRIKFLFQVDANDSAQPRPLFIGLYARHSQLLSALMAIHPYSGVRSHNRHGGNGWVRTGSSLVTGVKALALPISKMILFRCMLWLVIMMAE